jgi:hypothetical protein
MTEDRGAFKTNRIGLRPISVNCDVPSRPCNERDDKASLGWKNALADPYTICGNQF